MKDIFVCCVGWGEEDMPLAVARAMKKAPRVILRTAQCGCAEYLKRESVSFQALDELYESSEDFDQLDERIERVVLKAAEEEAVVYATPTLGDRAAAALLRGQETARGELALYAGDPCRRLSASGWEKFHPNAREDTLVTEITDRYLASEVKLRLMETYGDEAQIFFQAPDGTIQKDSLTNLDRMERYDHRACALVCGGAAYGERNALDLQDLTDIMEILRDRCPWDGEQTHESLRKYMLEEAYEAVDAIDRDSDGEMCEELGDVLFQIVFHAQIAKEHGAFEMRDVVDGVSRKMLRRHRHVFGGVEAETSREVAALWQQVKKEEKKYNRPEDAVLGVSTALPALTLAQKALDRARENGVALPEFGDDAGGRLLREAANTREDAEGALRRAVMKWMERLREDTDKGELGK